MSGYTLFDFPYSSASYRVRIALELKGISYQKVSINLREGYQLSDTFRSINSAGLVPALRLPDGTLFTQSLAILRYLDGVAEPILFPADPIAEARVSAMALMIACDIHPLNNLRVLGYIQKELSSSDEAKSAWYAYWVRTGFAALEAEVKAHGGQFCVGDSISAADVCLVPQMANARRFGVDVSDFERLNLVDAKLRTKEAFVAAAPTP